MEINVLVEKLEAKNNNYFPTTQRPPYIFLNVIITIIFYTKQIANLKVYTMMIFFQLSWGRIYIE